MPLLRLRLRLRLPKHGLGNLCRVDAETLANISHPPTKSLSAAAQCPVVLHRSRDPRPSLWLPSAKLSSPSSIPPGISVNAAFQTTVGIAIALVAQLLGNAFFDVAAQLIARFRRGAQLNRIVVMPAASGNVDVIEVFHRPRRYQ